MIKIITGKPGSGKSYYCVKDLKEKFFVYDPDLEEYNAAKGVTCISNIEGLNLPHLDLEYLADLYSDGDVVKFFTEKVQDQIHKRYDKIVYAIDECQKYFRYLTPKSDAETFYYFEKHRHYGDTIILLSQNKFRISKFLTALADVELRALSRSKKLNKNQMSYREIIDSQVSSVKHTVKNKEIFELYKSMNAKELDEPGGSKMLLTLVLPILAVLGGGYYLFNSFSSSKPETKNKKKIEQQSQKVAENKKNTANKKQSTKDQVKKDNPDRIVLLSYIKDGSSFLIVDPCTNSIVPLNQYPYPVTVRQSFSGSRFIFSSSVPCVKERERVENTSQTNERANNVY